MLNRKLLLADDSITIQKVVNLTFADEGVEVITAGDGDEAMRKFVEFSPDLVMADVNMPGIDGYTVCQMIKMDESTREIPVILLVGSFEPFDEDRANEVGANDYLTKPFQSIRQLVQKVSTLLEPENSAEHIENETDETIYADTQAEQLNPVSEISDELGDAALEDEIIQTNQVGTFPANEYQKFESNENVRNEISSEDVQDEPQAEVMQNFSGGFSFDNQSLDIEEAETGPLSVEELGKITSDSAINDIDSSQLKVYEFADEQEEFEGEQSYSPEFEPENESAADSDAEVSEFIKQSYGQYAESETPTAITEDISEIFDFSESNLLEIPIPVEENKVEEDNEISTRAEYEDSEESKIDQETKEEITAEESVYQTETAAETEEYVSEDDGQTEDEESGENAAESSEDAESINDSDVLKNFPPEVIDAIAEKVIQKISGNALQTIADQIALQMAGLVVERMDKEKINE